MKKDRFVNKLYVLVILLAGAMSCMADPVLKEVFDGRYRIGTALNGWQINGKPEKEVELVKRQYNAITAENDMKWERIHPGKDRYDFRMADKFVEFGSKNDMFILGHTLVWHSQTPRWVFRGDDGGPATREELLGRMKDHIDTVVGRYKGRVNAWDVVNEAVAGDGSLRKSQWRNIIGDDFIAKAFEYAHEADPEAELYYNDYDMWKPKHRQGVVQLVKRLQEKNLRIDGIGMQGHWGLEYPSIQEIEDSIVEYAGLGVKVMITELDISVLPTAWGQAGADIAQNYEYQQKLNPYADGLPEEVQQKLAARYAAIFKLFDKHADKIGRVTFWGVHDGNSWLNGWPVRGRKDYPLLFDRECKPKAAFDAVITNK